MPMIPFHAISASIASFFALLAAVKTWQHYKQTRRDSVKYLALDYFSVSVAMALLVPPAALFRSDLVPFFMSFSVFFLFLGVSFFFRVIAGFFRYLTAFQVPLFIFTVGTGVFLAVLAFVAQPTLTFRSGGLVSVYSFPDIYKIFFAVFIIGITSLFSGLVFFVKGFALSVFFYRLRAILFGTALLFIGIGVLLVVLEEGMWYNFFIVFAFLFFYLSAVLRKEEGEQGREEK